MPELADFQRDFGGALLDPDQPAPVRDARAFRVYRNTVARGLIDVLAANYPTVRRLVGDDWFEVCALVFARRSPPSHPVLALYGEGFPAFLAGFPPAVSLPYLADVAAIDLLWSRAHFAADDPAGDRRQVPGPDLETVLERPLRLHGTAQYAWFACPAPSLWRLNRPPAPDVAGVDVVWRAEGIALVRPGGAVEGLVLDASGLALIRAAESRATLGVALTAVLAADPDIDLAALLTTCLEGGFVILDGPPPHHPSLPDLAHD